MSEDIDAPVESDRVPGAPHPRETRRLVGQDGAVAAFAGAAAAGRLHHGWLITGPRGTGKATLAWAIARWLLAEADTPDLSVPEDHPVARRLRALSEPRLHLVRRSIDDKGRLRGEIVVEDIRKLLSFSYTIPSQHPPFPLPAFYHKLTHMLLRIIQPLNLWLLHRRQRRVAHLELAIFVANDDLGRVGEHVDVQP